MQYNQNFKNFKQQINLVTYAISQGYKVDPKKTTRHSVVLENNQNDKIVISKKNGVWVYFSVCDDQDNGTIIDFVKNRTSLSFAEIGKDLKTFDPKIAVSENDYQISEHQYDSARIEKIFNNCTAISHHDYLNGRGIVSELLSSDRFKTTIYKDRYNNVSFPHFKTKQICGLELKGQETSLMVRGSEKTLWRSNLKKDDEHLIIAEAPIDALSYHALFSIQKAFYIATSGGISSNQLNLIEHALCVTSNFKNTVVIADHDEGGNRFFQKIEKHLSAKGIPVAIKRHSPETHGNDWNDELMQHNQQ